MEAFVWGECGIKNGRDEKKRGSYIGTHPGGGLISRSEGAAKSFRCLLALGIRVIIITWTSFSPAVDYEAIFTDPARTVHVAYRFVPTLSCFDQPIYGGSCALSLQT